jgi:hypothetical protein
VTDSHLGRAVDKGVLGLSALIREKAARVEMKRTVFVLLGVIAVAPAWAHTLGDNSVIDSYRKYQVAAETPESNFMSDANQRHGPGQGFASGTNVAQHGALDRGQRREVAGAVEALTALRSCVESANHGLLHDCR